MENSQPASDAPLLSGRQSDGVKRAQGLRTDGPRERLDRLGLHSLSDAELIALILRTGTRDADAMTLSRRLLSEAGGIPGLAEISLNELSARRGIGFAKSASILASRELGRRLAGSRLERGAMVRSAEEG